jgi:hypothetical protein
MQKPFIASIVVSTVALSVAAFAITNKGKSQFPDEDNLPAQILQLHEYRVDDMKKNRERQIELMKRITVLEEKAGITPQ